MNHILQYRAQLMGIAILMVMMCHMHYLYPVFPAIRFGKTGVELFFFISGMGLMLSMQKNADLFSFYVKRYIRILPAFYLVSFIISVYFSRPLTWGELLLVNSPFWFISTIAFFYLLYPLYFHLSKKINPLYLFLLIIAAIWLSFAFTTDGNIQKWYKAAPSFLLGCLCVQCEKILKFKRAWALSAIVLFVTILLLHIVNRKLFENTGILECLRTLFTPGILIIFSEILHRLSKHKWILTILGFYGALSLEFYLCDCFGQSLLEIYCGPQYAVFQFIVLIPFVYIIHKICLLVQLPVKKYLEKRQQKLAAES